MISTDKPFLSKSTQSMDQKPSLFHDQMLCKLAMSYQFISKEDYERAQRLQAKELDSGLKTTLMEIFLKHNLLSKDKIEILHLAKELLTRMRKEKRFGAIAVKKGLLSESDITLALNTQKTEKKEIGHILKASGLLSDEQCRQILDIQKSITVKLPSLNEVLGVLRECHNKTEMPPSVPATCELKLSEDECAAVLLLPPDQSTIDISEVHKVLEQNDVTFGILDDAVIQEHLDLQHLGLNSFIVAKGHKGRAGSEAESTLHFIPRELTAGLIDTSGNMDYRNRGDIPFVKKGDLLAELLQMEQCTSGLNVFGKRIDMEEVDDTFFTLNGNGTFLNESGDKLYAEYDGEPGLTMDGTVCVLSELRVENVNFETGNISFPGNIFISGKVSPDFEVEGFNITAEEVSGARIVAKGEIMVAGGIIGGEIFAGGGLHATYIKDSKVSCVGDIVSDKEIIDSIIDTSGSCTVRGHILSSKINAGKGVVANNIGSKTSRPSHLEVGIFSSVIHIITRQEEIAKGLEQTLSEHMEERNELTHKLGIVKDTLEKMKQHLSINKQHYQTFKKNIHQIETKREKPFPNGQAKLVELYKKITSDKETIAALNRNVAHHQHTLESLQTKIRQTRAEQATARRIIHNMIQWMNENEANPSILVSGEIYEGTEIVSPNTTLVLKDDFCNVKIKEVQRTIPHAEANGKKEVHHALEITRSRRQSVSI